MPANIFLTHPTKVSLDEGFTKSPCLSFKDASGTSVAIFLPSEAFIDQFIEAVQIFSLSRQPSDIAA